MGRYAKAIIGAIVAGGGALEIALMDNVVTSVEWVRVGMATVLALGAVWGVQNSPPPKDPPQV